MDKPIYKCECGFVTHFEKALEAHCRFRHHHPATEVKEEQKPKAVKAEKTVRKTATKKNTVRKPRTKKAETKE